MSRAARRLGYRWHLRRLMAEQGLFQTSQLRPLLAERGIVLSAVQVYRLVAQTPERLSLRTLVALCDILGCTPADLIEPVVEAPKRRARAGGERDPRPAPGDVKPRRARVLREEDQ
jgi:DNA-binding Xre family transcriptional regulator